MSSKLVAVGCPDVDGFPPLLFVITHAPDNTLT